MDELTIDQIKTQYPDEWVLLGNPNIIGASVLGGVVIDHSKDKREIAYRQPNWRLNFQTAITVFTGQKVKNRKFWL
jgi:hypothetical protein